MQKIIFSNGTSLEVANVNGQSVYYQGAQREVLELQFDPVLIGFNELEQLTASEFNTSRLRLMDPEGTEYLHENYSIRTSLGIRSIEVVPATSTNLAVTEDRLCVTLAQLTYQELQLARLQNTVDALVIAGLEG